MLINTAPAVRFWGFAPDNIYDFIYDKILVDICKYIHYHIPNHICLLISRMVACVASGHTNISVTDMYIYVVVYVITYLIIYLLLCLYIFSYMLAYIHMLELATQVDTCIHKYTYMM